MTQGESKGEEQRGQKRLFAQQQSRSWMSEQVQKILKKSKLATPRDIRNQASGSC